MMKYTKKKTLPVHPKTAMGRLKRKKKKNKKSYCKEFCVTRKHKEKQLPSYLKYIPQKLFIAFLYLRSLNQWTIRKAGSKAIMKVT